MGDAEDIDLLSAFIGTFDSDTEEAEANEQANSISSQYLPDENNAKSGISNQKLPPSSPLNGKRKQTGLVSASNALEECDIFSPKSNTEVGGADTKALFGDVSDDDDMITKTDLNENGAEIRRLMKDREQQSIQSTGFYDRTVTISQIKNKWNKGSRVAHNVQDSTSLRIPDLGLSILNPKVSIQFLKEAMHDKDLVLLSRVGLRNPDNKPSRDWITIGVIASKTETKRSSSGSEFIILRLADMGNVDVEVSLFLFGRSYDKYWKLPVATTIGLMNPALMKNDKANTRSVATMNINSESQLLVIGTSKDFGTCGSITKNGNKCTNIVNKDACDKCRFHTMKEHKAARQKRAELNVAFSSKEPSCAGSRIMSKLSTTRSADDCFTYAGRSYLTKASKPQPKVSLKSVLNKSAQKGNLQSTLKLYKIKPEDEERLSAAAAVKQTKAVENLEELISRPTTASMQFVKHLVSKEIKSEKSSSDAGLKIISIKPKDLIRHEKEKLAKQLSEKRGLSSPANVRRGQVELNSNPPSTGATTMTASQYKMLVAKQKAKEVVTKKGGLQKQEVNDTRKKLTDKQKEQVKRRFDDSIKSSSNNDDSTKKSPEDGEKRSKLKKLDINSDAYKELRNKKSVNSHLVKQVEDDREKQYFGMLEKKESYETKLLNTHMIESEIYYCTKCDYQDWSLAKRCFQEKHRYKKFPALKRFFNCKNCKERLVTHEKMPTKSCKKCGGTNYAKGGMIHEKKVTLAGQELSLRGNEETKLGSYDSTVSLDVL